MPDLSFSHSLGQLAEASLAANFAYFPLTRDRLRERIKRKHELASGEVEKMKDLGRQPPIEELNPLLVELSSYQDLDDKNSWKSKIAYFGYVALFVFKIDKVLMGIGAIFSLLLLAGLAGLAILDSFPPSVTGKEHLWMVYGLTLFGVVCPGVFLAYGWGCVGIRARRIDRCVYRIAMAYRRHQGLPDISELDPFPIDVSRFPMV